jgi:cyclase
MIGKRLIAVITVKDGRAVQSFGYGRYLPMGSAEVLAMNYDRWGADEIILQCIDRSLQGCGPDFALLERVAKAGLSTPLVYSGGIRHAEDARQAVSHGADRIIFDALLHDDIAVAARVGDAIGTQAVLANLPLCIREGEPAWYDYRTRTLTRVSDTLLRAINNHVVSELVITDWQNEGRPSGFDERLAEGIGATTPRILFGGISDPVQAARLLSHEGVVAVAIGNFLAYREHAVQWFRNGIAAANHVPLTRPATYRDREETLYGG